MSIRSPGGRSPPTAYRLYGRRHNEIPHSRNDVDKVLGMYKQTWTLMRSRPCEIRTRGTTGSDGLRLLPRL
jgi:hypothetical protein